MVDSDSGLNGLTGGVGISGRMLLPLRASFASDPQKLGEPWCDGFHNSAFLPSLIRTKLFGRSYSSQAQGDLTSTLQQPGWTTRRRHCGGGHHDRAGQHHSGPTRLVNATVQTALRA